MSIMKYEDFNNEFKESKEQAYTRCVKVLEVAQKYASHTRQSFIFNENNIIERIEDVCSRGFYSVMSGGFYEWLARFNPFYSLYCWTERLLPNLGKVDADDMQNLLKSISYRYNKILEQGLSYQKQKKEMQLICDKIKKVINSKKKDYCYKRGNKYVFKRNYRQYYEADLFVLAIELVLIWVRV